MKTKRVDIIIPVYNVEPYLRRCLNSVLKQTFKHWRAICVDDGSTDESGKILGVNITGLEGTDLPLNRKTKRLPNILGGTSYATPIRTAKLALNDMMEGIL